MFIHSQRLRAALRTMRHYGGRVLFAVRPWWPLWP